MEESCFCFWKAKETALLKKQAKIRERGAFASGNSCFISSPVQKLKNSAKQNSWRVCRFSPWNLARCFRIWLEGLGKVGLFRCQSGIRRLGLGAFGK